MMCDFFQKKNWKSIKKCGYTVSFCETLRLWDATSVGEREKKAEKRTIAFRPSILLNFAVDEHFLSSKIRGVTQDGI